MPPASQLRMVQNDSSTDTVSGVLPRRQADLAARLAIQVDGLGHTAAERQGDGAVDGQHLRTPGIGVEVVRHEVADAIRQRTAAPGRLAIVGTCTHADDWYRASRTENADRPTAAADYLAVGSVEQGIVSAEVQGTEVSPRGG
ncbi:hypothetical protein PPS11_01509 [Pseudomonas putida S11]|nr:hypothetical protein PPS11_01509 [Pseudomonas putida S11]